MEDENHIYTCTIHEGGVCNCALTVREAFEMEKWYGIFRPIEAETEASKLFNNVLDKFIKKYGDYQLIEPE